MRMKAVVPIIIAVIAVVSLAYAIAVFVFPATTGSLGFVKAIYGDAPRTENGQVNVTMLFEVLGASECNTYNFLFRKPNRDFDELKRMLPLAKERGIDVWVTIAPPSEVSPELRSDMEYVDYIGWGRRFAELSLQHDNFKAWSIDNVLIDGDFFTPSYLEEITGAARQINPNFKFIPVVYYPNVVSKSFDSRSVFFDGVQFYYTNFAVMESDESSVLLPQLQTLRTKFQKPVILGIYATPPSPSYPTSPAYVDQLINLAKQHTDGVMIYAIGQKGEKLAIIKKHFSQ
jgi:ABC-type antimicrobial peptide transport system permease subunit